MFLKLIELSKCKIIIRINLEKTIPKHTPVLMVRNLLQYVIKHAKSEHNELDLTMNSLVVHFVLMHMLELADL